MSWQYNIKWWLGKNQAPLSPLCGSTDICRNAPDIQLESTNQSKEEAVLSVPLVHIQPHDCKWLSGYVTDLFCCCFFPLQQHTWSWLQSLDVFLSAPCLARTRENGWRSGQYSHLSYLIPVSSREQIMLPFYMPEWNGVLQLKSNSEIRREIWWCDFILLSS